MEQEIFWKLASKSVQEVKNVGSMMREEGTITFGVDLSRESWTRCLEIRILAGLGEKKVNYVLNLEGAKHIRVVKLTVLEEETGKGR